MTRTPSVKKTFVVMNTASGGGNDEALVRRLRELFVEAGAPAEILLAQGSELDATIESALAQGAGRIVAAGGDGTVSAVAGALVGSTVELGVLPLGTLNHFAKDMGLPLDLEDAVRAIATGCSVRVDLGEVNGRVFINNSSLGLYTDIVRDRDDQRRRLGRGKWPALAWASLSALRRYPFMRVRLCVGDEELVRKTPFVFIGNNQYQMQGFSVGARESLSRGHLCLYVAQRPSRWRLVQLAARALVGRLSQARDFDVINSPEIVVESPRRQLRVATDGEITLMTTPLKYRIRPASLSVVGVARPLEQEERED